VDDNTQSDNRYILLRLISYSHRYLIRFMFKSRGITIKYQGQAGRGKRVLFGSSHFCFSNNGVNHVYESANLEIHE
jgi:hypothetical protein